MKKFLISQKLIKFSSILFLIVSFIFVSSCSKDDNSTSVTNSSCGMSFTLNGKSWCGKPDYSYGMNDQFYITGKSGKNEILTININTYKGIGTYNSLNAFITYEDSLTYIGVQITVSITKDDNTSIEGTFAFQANPAGQSNSVGFTITDGKFKIMRN